MLNIFNLKQGLSNFPSFLFELLWPLSRVWLDDCHEKGYYDSITALFLRVPITQVHFYPLQDT